MKSKFISSTIRIAVITFTAQFILAVTPARAQLDETCTVTVNGQTVNVGFGGEFQIGNLPANNNLVRVYAICTKNGKTRYGRSLAFQVLSGQTLDLNELDMMWSDTPFVSPTSITAVPDKPFLTAVGETAQIRVTAKLSDGTQADVTAPSKGSTFTSSNPNIARVNSQGVVTAVSTGDVSITVNNEGATAVRIIRVLILAGDPLTTVQGFVRLEDGTPVTGANVTIQNLSGSAVTGANGKFSIPGVITQFGKLSVNALITLGSQQFFGRASGLNPVPGGFTDAGIITLRPICEPRFAEGLFPGAVGAGESISALAVFDDGTGPALYAGGTFTSIGGIPANRIAKWNGTTWSALGSGVSASFPAIVFSLAVFNDGTGPALYAGGDFTIAGGVTTRGIAKWNGAAWFPLDSGLNTAAKALAVFDDGTGSALYAAGFFTTAGGLPANRIAKWNGTAWSPLGSGVNNFVNALAVFDDGTGSALYAAGAFFTAGGVSTNRTAKWNGVVWSRLIGNIGSGAIDALAVLNDGTGSALYATGTDPPIENDPIGKIAKWNGAVWVPFDGFTNGSIRAFAVFDDGTGSALYMGGGFSTAAGVTVNRIAKWSGSGWLPLGSGMNGTVNTFVVFDDGSGPALFVGGHFTTADGVESAKIAKWYRPTQCP